MDDTLLAVRALRESGAVRKVLGMATHEIAACAEELYGLWVSRERVLKVTEAVP